MKKVIFLLLLVNGLGIAHAQELNGVWMSNNNPIMGAKDHNRADGGILFDFDNNTTGHIKSDSFVKMKVNLKKSKIKAKGIKGKLKFRKFGKDSMVMKGKKHTLYVFKKLDLTHKIEMGKKDLASFLIDQQCGPIQGIKVAFTAEQFFLDKQSKQPHTKNLFINYSRNDNGYWFIRKFKGNAFLVFTIGQNQPENILQILSLNLNGFNLHQLQVNNWMKNLTKINTCL